MWWRWNRHSLGERGEKLINYASFKVKIKKNYFKTSFFLITLACFILWLIYDIIYDWRETHQITEAEGTTPMQCLLQAPTPTFACSLTLPIEAAKQVHFHREFVICFCYCLPADFTALAAMLNTDF